jgi:hypothetical protein
MDSYGQRCNQDSRHEKLDHCAVSACCGKIHCNCCETISSHERLASCEVWTCFAFNSWYCDCDLITCKHGFTHSKPRVEQTSKSMGHFSSVAFSEVVAVAIPPSLLECHLHFLPYRLPHQTTQAHRCRQLHVDRLLERWQHDHGVSQPPCVTAHAPQVPPRSQTFCHNDNR